jgi:hypothetical protein
MYQSKFWPGFGHELAVQLANELKGSQVDRSFLDSTVHFLLSFLTTGRRLRRSARAMLTGCVITILSGCGGMTFNSKSLLASAVTTSTTAALSTISCGTGSLTGAQTKACSIYLSASPTTPATVSLTSSNAALTVPPSVVVAAGSKTAGFNAVDKGVSKTVSVTITGKLGIGTKTDVITLYPATSTPTPTSGSTLSKVSCGTQTLTGPTTRACSLYMSSAPTSQTAVKLSTSNSALQVPSSVNVPAGAMSAGFIVTALAVTTTETATLTASANGVQQIDVIQLVGTSGAGSTQHKVTLSWSAPTGSKVSIVGYAVYRTTVGGSGYVLLSLPFDTLTSYTDATVKSGITYDYVVRSVDATGVQSAPSNSTTVTIP